MDRRRFLRFAGGVAALAALGAGVGLGLEDTGPGRGAATRPPRRRVGRASPSTTRASAPPATWVGELGLPIAQWVVAENERPGTTSWLAIGAPAHGLEGFADRVSAQRGDEVTLYVNTTASSFVVEAYRMGWYQGLGARLVARVGPVAGEVQPPPSFTPGINMVECHWRPSVRLGVANDWPPGDYLLKLLADNGWSSWVPLTVRDDGSDAALVVQNSVTTWQAYNLWGGYSLYGSVVAPGDSYANRSRVVSFDRPYPLDWEYGSADFIGNELPLVMLVERHGLDVTYWTDVDLHERPELLLRHRCLVSLGHDEYWSAEMRAGATSALGHGVNLAFLGANACYRHIRLEPSPLGPDRREVCYKDPTEDPLYGKQDARVTANWPSGPDPRPESEFIGDEYVCYGASGGLTVVEPSSFVLAGTGLAAGAVIPDVLGSEFDRYVPSISPPNVEIICHSPAPSVCGPSFSDMTWYTRAGGGGVFDTGTAAFVDRLFDNPGTLPPSLIPPAVPTTTSLVTRIALNVLAALGRGPGSVLHPSVPNWQRFYAPGGSVPVPID